MTPARGPLSSKPIDISAFDDAKLDQFVALIDFGPACWNWLGRSVANEYGGQPYGRFHNLASHRVAYALWVGPLTRGLTIDHLCRNRLCVRPDHLEEVTHRVNLLRGDTIQAKRAAVTHCPQGHAYDITNTRITPKGQRECRRCLANRQRRYHARKKAALELSEGRAS